MRRLGSRVIPRSNSRGASVESNCCLNWKRSVSSTNSKSSGGATYPFMHKDKSAYPTNQYDRVARIILVRHGESLGNVDENAYVDTADWRIPLSGRGREQSVAAGSKVKEIIGKEGQVFFYVSPYHRTRDTLKGIMNQLDHRQIVGVREEPRISEQQFGNFQCYEEVQKAKQERKAFGRFYYRFPNGEAGFDVYSRVTSFISTVLRDAAHLRAEGHVMGNLNLCIVTHGLTLRLFLMRWLQYSVDEFEASVNPPNGSVVVLERRTNPSTGLQWFELEPQALQLLNLPSYFDQQKFRLLDDLASSTTAIDCFRPCRTPGVVPDFDADYRLSSALTAVKPRRFGSTSPVLSEILCDNECAGSADADESPTDAQTSSASSLHP